MRGKKQERILRVLLNHPDGSLTVYRLAKEADCTHVWALEVLTKLRNRHLTTITKVLNPQALFAYWLGIATPPTYREYNLQDPLELLTTTTLRYAITTYYADSLTQHYLFPSRLDIYIHAEDQPAWHTLLTQHGLVGKGNTRVLIDDSHVFYNTLQKKEYTLVSIPQLILDLLREHGSATEAAELLLKKKYHGALH
jgi:hypothetical protein